MGTRSAICKIEKKDNKLVITGARVHWDGYVMEGIGQALYNNIHSFEDFEKTKIFDKNTGYISSLNLKTAIVESSHEGEDNLYIDEYEYNEYDNENEYAIKEYIAKFFINSDLEYIYFFNGKDWTFIERTYKKSLFDWSCIKSVSMYIQQYEYIEQLIQYRLEQNFSKEKTKKIIDNAYHYQLLELFNINAELDQKDQIQILRFGNNEINTLTLETINGQIERNSNN